MTSESKPRPAQAFEGSAIGGFLEDALGFNAVNWMAAIAAGLSVLVLFLGLRPVERRARSSDTARAPTTGDR